MSWTNALAKRDGVCRSTIARTRYALASMTRGTSHCTVSKRIRADGSAGSRRRAGGARRPARGDLAYRVRGWSCAGRDVRVGCGPVRGRRRFTGPARACRSAASMARRRPATMARSILAGREDGTRIALAAALAAAADAGLARRLAGVGAAHGHRDAGAGTGAGAHRVAGEIRTPAAGAVRDRRPGRLRPGDAGDARPHPCRRRQPDVRATNFYIVLYDDVSETRALPVLRRPARSLRRRARSSRSRSTDMPNSLTVALLRHGQPLLGPSAAHPRQLGVQRDPRARPRQRRLARRADAPRATASAARSSCRATTTPRSYTRRGPRAAGVTWPSTS